MEAALLDSDTLNEILKGENALVVSRAIAYRKQHGRFAISAMTIYELLRGLKEKNALKQLVQLDEFCANSQILPIGGDIFDRASDLWVLARSLGREGRDADLLIAATALESGLSLVTGNTKDFDWIPALRLENWRTP